MARTVEPVEAVIISGPRRGEIIHLPVEALAEMPGEDLRMLDEALDTLIAAIERLSTEVRATNEMLRERVEAM